MPLTVIALGLLLSAPPRAGGVSWNAPPGWKQEAPRPMRVATYHVPGADDAECAVFFFGPGQGGSVEDNQKRWVAQFEQPDGTPSEKAAKVSRDALNGLTVTRIDLSGTYTASAGPMAPVKVKRPGYRLLGAIVQAPEGLVFFKLTGPAQVVGAAQKDFQKLLQSLRK